MRYYILSGEASGDLHGSNLIRSLREEDPQAEFRAWGGEEMQEAGATIVKHYRDLAFMGFAEVISNLSTILRNISFCKSDIESWKPDVLILIDYPGFNLRIAKWAHEKKYKVIYYISPQVWAWKENRVKSIRKYVDKMLVILPFEKEFYRKWNYEVEYVGHPLVEVIEKAKKENALPALSEKPVIALLPGSRTQELKTKLPLMLAVSMHFPNHQFIVAQAPGQTDEFYDELMLPYPNVKKVKGNTYGLLLQSQAALVTSGTATLETALLGIPEVVCYKANSLSYEIAKRIITIKYISLVNLIMDREVVKELIQHELTVENMQKELSLLLNDLNKRARIAEDYLELHHLLLQGGFASRNAARAIVTFMKR
jgi:lipid-A-disaccharide synthase